jgi:3-methyladenine DNA glycosylase AlkD
MTVEEVIVELRNNFNQRNIDGMVRFGIASTKAFGVSAPVIKSMAKNIGRNHQLAIELWETGYLEARAVAMMIGDPKLVTKSLMNKWVRDFDSWAVCDGTCLYLFCYTPFAFDKALEWCNRKEEYVRRAGFAMMAVLAVHDKKRDDKDFLNFLPLIKKYSVDERNFVKKAVNWALRQIGKRSKFLNKKALKLAKEIQALDSRSAKWIANDAIRELTTPKILSRLKR